MIYCYFVDNLLTIILIYFSIFNKVQSSSVLIFSFLLQEVQSLIAQYHSHRHQFTDGIICIERYTVYINHKYNNILKSTKTDSMADQLSEFNSIYPEFLEFVKKHEIPPKIYEKLMFLANRIYNKPVANNYQEVEQHELDQLNLLDQAGKITLFLSVTKCIMGKVSVDFIGSRKAYFKKEGLFSFWKPCYITYDSDNLIVTKKQIPTNLPFKQMQISKSMKSEGKKHFFMLGLMKGKNTTRYFIGMDDPKIAHELFCKLRELIVSKIALKEKPSPSNISSSSLPAFETVSEIPKQIDMSAIMEQQMQQKREQEIINQLIQEFELDEIQDELQYQIHENMENGRIIRHVTNRGLFKVLVMLDYQNPELIFDYYAQPKQWNMEIQETKLTGKIDQNTYVVYEKHKPFSFTSWSRDFVIMKKAAQIRGKYYLLEKSVEHRDFPPVKNAVRAQLKKRVTVCLPHPTNSKLLLMISRMEVDYGGYNTADDNINMLLKYLRVYNTFPKYCLQKSFGQQVHKLFTFSRENCKTVIMQKRERLSSEDLSEAIVNSKIQMPSPIGKIKQQKSLADYLQKYINDPLDEGIIELLKTQKHNSYHIHNKYSFAPRQNTGLKHKGSESKQDDFIFQNVDWIVNQENEMVFVNQRAIEAQKDVIKFIFKQISSNFISGKSIMNMSLPVDIFDRRSILQRSAQSLGYAPIFLREAGKLDNELDQFSYIVTFILSIALLELRIQKPFNPILGQTFQGYLGGIPIYFQQISHHPPISAYYMKCDEFELYGNALSVAEMGINSAMGYNGGVYHIKFPKNQAHFECVMPAGQVSGLMFGERKFKPAGKMFVVNRKSQMVCECGFGKDKSDIYPAGRTLSPSDIAGGIFKVTPEFITKLMNEKKKPHFSGLNKKDVIQKLGTVEGLWNDKVMVNGKIIRSRYDPLPYQLEYEQYPLASNSNYRQDILFRRMGNLEQAQTMKEVLQNIQRNDRKLRANKKH